MIGKMQAQDLTEGPILKKLLLFFLPMLAGSLFQQLYTTLDAVIVGQFAGKSGLAAIDAVYNLVKLPTNFFIGLSTGATILISQCFGAKKPEDLSKAVHTAVAFSFAGGALLSVAGILLAPAGLRLMNVPEDLYAMTLSYVRIIFSGLAAVMIYNISAGILRAVGNSKTPFYYLIVASVLNTALDFVFVGLWGMGVAGAALSTVLAQWLSAALVLRALMRMDSACKVVPRSIRFHRPTLRSIFTLGIPIALQASLSPIANMMIQSSINAMGTDPIAAWALCGKLDFLFWLVLDALAAAVSTFVAQNYGARHFARIRKGVRLGLGAAFLLSAPICGALYVWYMPLGRLFLGRGDLHIIGLAGELMRFLAPLYLLCIFSEVLSATIHGAGETVRPMILKLVCTCAFRILWILLIVPRHHTLHTIIGSYPASWFLTSACVLVYYMRFQKKKLSAPSGADLATAG